ncbi:GrpB family protein [Paenibacillus shunpengii]|uniref:GrpB family protein n=1 Tax=Paenibacillus shunpengii TaxID=2054424 RepID=A0ABW5SPV0_9BACL|nr:GrpB family protein [Paenibacillus sp. PDC88]
MIVKVNVVNYNEYWIELFEVEAKNLKVILGDQQVDIHHIGSTSVPGLRAKPIIDIMPVVHRIDLVDTYNPQMERLGYECMGEFGMPGRRYFRKGGDDRTHQIHIFEAGDVNVARHLAFRDYLRTHPEDAAKYASLKTELAQKFPNDIQSYSYGKDALVKEIEAKALTWYEGQKS